MTFNEFIFCSVLTVASLAATVVRSAEPAADQTGQVLQVAGCCDVSCSDATCGNGCGDCVGNRCCRGRDVCCATVERVKEEKSCYCVDCEKICVPKVVCPWAKGGSGLTLFNCLKSKKCNGCGCGQSCGDCCDSCCDTCNNGCGNCCGGCCIPRCGEVKAVRVLDSKDYEVTKCECKWKIRRLPPCGSSCGSCCDDCGSIVD